MFPRTEWQEQREKEKVPYTAAEKVVDISWSSDVGKVGWVGISFAKYQHGNHLKWRRGKQN